MSEELLVNASPEETRVATIENGVLTELQVERASRRGRVGNIYQGKVARVLPGMEAAFVDIGLDRAAFLHVSDIALDPADDGVDARPRAIQEHLHEGQLLLVQVVKDPIGTKGARLTTHLTLPSRLLVYMPREDTLGVSSKIEDEAERDRLRTIVCEASVDAVDAERAISDGFIVRTAAEGESRELILQDRDFLVRLWRAICRRAERAAGVAVIHEDLPLVLRMLRDLHGDSVERIRVDSRENLQRAVAFADEFLHRPELRLEHYTGERPIFDLFNVEDEIQRALERKVPLKSGGYLILDQTESMTTIDVNTGGFVGHHNLEETIFKTNLEAAQAIARQLKLRNLGGIIIIDFIDMMEDEHKRQVMRALEKALDRDHAKCQVCSVSQLGLVEMTRKRTRESLEGVLLEPCTNCNGRGKVKSTLTLCYEISREIIRQVRQFDVRSLAVLASQDVVEQFQNEQSDVLAELEAFVGVPIRLQGEPIYTREQYDVVLF
ncbi:MAG: ribonuclease G [Pseudomonadota bacterium]